MITRSAPSVLRSILRLARSPSENPYDGKFADCTSPEPSRSIEPLTPAPAPSIKISSTRMDCGLVLITKVARAGLPDGLAQPGSSPLVCVEGRIGPIVEA